MAVKETLCTSCNKREVCKYSEKFIKTIQQTDAIRGVLLDDDIRIFRINVTCKEYNGDKSFIKRDYSQQ